LSEVPIDEAVLEGLELLRPYARPNLAKTIIMLFLESVPRALKDLETGLATNDPALLYKASHTLKSSSAAVGAGMMFAECADLELLARRGSVPDAATRVHRIMQHYREAERALRSWCMGQSRAVTLPLILSTACVKFRPGVGRFKRMPLSFPSPQQGEMRVSGVLCANPFQTGPSIRKYFCDAYLV
jgi:HPt (histidine-containing phosphotransfer) domain-containing protein